MSAPDSSTLAKTCRICGAPLEGMRSDAVCCGKKCAKRAWDLSNRERKREHDRTYYVRHAEEMRARQRRGRANNPELWHEYDRRSRQSEAGRKWWVTYERDKTVKAASDRAYREAHQAEITDYLRQWAQDNPHRIAEYRHRRSAHKAAAEGYATAEKIQARIDFYGGRCWVCAAPWEQIDHVKPLAKHGSGWPANLRPICKSCNASKKATWPYDPEPRRMYLQMASPCPTRAR